MINLSLQYLETGKCRSKLTGFSVNKNKNKDKDKKEFKTKKLRK